MSLPAVPQIAATFGTTAGLAALTLPVFMLGFSAAPIVYGPLSDRFGRKPVLLFGCFLYAASGAACALAPSIAALLVCRLLQGAGAGAGNAMLFAIVRDLFDGAVARAKLSYVSVIMTLAPMVAPTIGAQILVIAKWRSIFGVLGFFGFVLTAVVALCFAETAPRHARQGLRLEDLAKRYRRVLTSPISAGYALVNGLTFGVMFAYISGSPIVMIQVFHQSPVMYAFLFALTALGLMMGSFLNGRLATRGVPPYRLLTFALVLASCATLTLVLGTAGGFATVASIMPLLIATTFCNGMVTPNATQGAIHPFPEIAGIAGAVLSSLQMLCGAFSGALVAGLAVKGPVMVMTGVMAVLAFASLGVYFGIVRRAERGQEAFAAQDEKLPA